MYEVITMCIGFYLAVKLADLWSKRVIGEYTCMLGLVGIILGFGMYIYTVVLRMGSLE
jgi:hypothetical protein